MTAPVDLDAIDAIEALLVESAKDSPIPWRVGPRRSAHDRERRIYDAGDEPVADSYGDHDADAIVAIRNAAPTLLAELRALRAATRSAFVELARIGGYSTEGADLLLRAMAAKTAGEMGKQRSVFIERAIDNGFPEGKAARVFDVLAALDAALARKGGA